MDKATIKEVVTAMREIGGTDLSFKRTLKPCELAGLYCPVKEPCTTCAEFFNDQPWWYRALATIRFEWRTRDLKRRHKRFRK